VFWRTGGPKEFQGALLGPGEVARYQIGYNLITGGLADLLEGEQAIPIAAETVEVDISAHSLSGAPTRISPFVIAPNALTPSFGCVLIAGATSTEFTVALLGTPEIAGFKIGYTLIP